MSRWAELRAEFTGDPKWLSVDRLYVGRDAANAESHRYVITCPTGSENGPSASAITQPDGIVVMVDGPLRDTYDHDVFHALAWFVAACQRCIVHSATFKWSSDTGPDYSFEWTSGKDGGLRRTDKRGVLDAV